MSELDKKITKARVQLVLHEPFFGTLVLNTIPTPTDQVEVAATDGHRFYYNPENCKDLDVEELKFIAAHEAMHCAFEHMKRRGRRDHDLWNAAGDYVINLALTDAGFRMPKLPANLLEKAKKAGIKEDNLGLIDEKHRGKNADVIYTELFNSGKKIKCGTCVLIYPKDGKEGDGKSGDKNKGGSSPRKITLGEGDDKVPDWPVVLAQAAHKARMQGTLPSYLEEFINQMLNPKVPWNEMLRQYLTKFTKEEPRWSPPSKKFLHKRIYLPSMRGETAEIVIGIDTSGSVGSEELQQFYGEVDAIRRTYRMKVWMIYVDAEVHRVDEVEPWDDLNFKIVGRGGTDFRPCFKEIEKRGIVPDVCIYLTDGDGSFPKDAPEYDVLWVLSKGKRDVPFGDTIIIDD